MKSAHFLRFSVITLILAACSAVPPTGPNVLALPPAGKNLAQFSQDDRDCRVYAQRQIGGAAPQQDQSRKTATGAVAGTGVGGAAGALAGAAAGNAGAGAAIGAASGLRVGSAVGAGYGSMSTAELQQHYNIAYAQCMTAQGNTVQPPSFGWDYGSYAYPYPDWEYDSPWFGPGLTFGFFGVDHFHHHGVHDHDHDHNHDFGQHSFHPHEPLHADVRGATHGSFHHG